MERDDWNRRYDTEDLLWRAEPNRFLASEVLSLWPTGAPESSSAPLAGPRALDIGTGEGRNAVWLAEQGWSVTAVDFSDVGLAKAQRLAEAKRVGVEWVLADIRHYQPDTASYGLVVVLYLHLPAADRRAIHRRSARALADGGTLLVIGHDSTNITDGYGGPQDPDLLFSPDEVLDDLADVDGLSVERADRVIRLVPTAGGDRTAVDTLVRVARRGP